MPQRRAVPALLLTTYSGVNNIYNPFRFKDMSSQDAKVGFRWALGGPVLAAATPPLLRKY